VIASNYTNQQSFVGRIVVWSIQYKGNAALNEEGAPTNSLGTMRLDAACTAPGTPCIP
jgi:hypothetical protein